MPWFCFNCHDYYRVAHYQALPNSNGLIVCRFSNVCFRCSLRR